MNVITAKNGDIIGVGTKNRHFNFEEAVTSGWIYRLSPEGEILWERNILDWNIQAPFGQKKQGSFSNIMEMEDESLVIVGKIIDTYEDGTRNPNLWLLKLDKDGCFFPDCGEDQLLITSVVDIHKEEIRIKYYPNPVESVLHIEFSEELDLSLIRVMDLFGRIVYSERFSREISLYEIDCSSFFPGIYFFEVAGEKGSVVRKFVKY